MKLAIELNKIARTTDLEIAADRVRGTIDGRAIEASVVETAPSVYSVLLGGEPFEVRIEEGADGLRAFANGQQYDIAVRDPRRWQRNRGVAAEAQGRQKLTAPMPGKVVRLLVSAGDRVEAGQGIVVVEAMKMQNEVRSPKSGTVEELLVREGQTVNAGDALGYIS